MFQHLQCEKPFLGFLNLSKYYSLLLPYFALFHCLRTGGEIAYCYYDSSVWLQINSLLLYQFVFVRPHFEGVSLTLTALKISNLEQLNRKISARLSFSFPRLKVARLIKQFDINSAVSLPTAHPNHSTQPKRLE
ncbi:hypothetical protein EAG18_20540 [Pseudoalteromonas sp. J010]|nr:hypothetical protein EAG18_20540 [Pseudoalteromonas sp. J010]